jgi:predicted nucleic acid-binding protein
MPQSLYTLDTNAVIDFINDDEHAAPILSDILAGPAIPSYISTITEGELFAFSRLTDSEITRIEDFLQLVTIIPVDSRVARLAGRLKATYRMELGDSLVAATALLMRSTLLTRNVRDCRKIPQLSLQAI